MLKTKEKYPDPRSWAAFILVGDASTKNNNISSRSCDSATLQAQEQNTKINIRVGAGQEFEAINYGEPNDSVTILASQTDSQGLVWFRIDFPQKDTQGWVRSDFVNKNCK